MLKCLKRTGPHSETATTTTTEVNRDSSPRQNLPNHRRHIGPSPIVTAWPSQSLQSWNVKKWAYLDQVPRILPNARNQSN